MNWQGVCLGPLIREERLRERVRAVARIGATGNGGVNRQALTPEDTEARRLLLSWAEKRGYSAKVDPIGNLFIRREGTHRNLAPVMTGSHLDTQPTGGNFDGVFGVLAGFEVLETLDDARVKTGRPIELVVWMNEEGSRFPPTTMGSAVAAGAIPLAEALNTCDAKGVSVREALANQLALLPTIVKRDLNPPAHAYVEAHIEQGPILESKNCQIGVVTGIQGLRVYQVDVAGFESHAGTTPLRDRRDALVAAVALLSNLQTELRDPEELLRFTVGRLEVDPGSPNTVPGHVAFTIDLRHPDLNVLSKAGLAIETKCRGEVARCEVTTRLLLDSSPVRFDPSIAAAIRSAARQRKFQSMEIMSGATHDAKFMAGRVATGMVFIPCAGGLSHNEAESVRDCDLVAGAQVLCDSILALTETNL